jgi:hypothetical protein
MGETELARKVLLVSIGQLRGVSDRPANSVAFRVNLGVYSYCQKMCNRRSFKYGNQQPLGVTVRIDCIHVGDIPWAKPAWADDTSQALVAHANGYELEIGPNSDNPKKWDWLCKTTAEISETPEIIDSGTASSPSGAKRGAGNAANRAQRERAKAKANEPKPEPEPPTVSPADQPAENAVEKVEEAVAVEMAVQKPKRTRKQPVAA